MAAPNLPLGTFGLFISTIDGAWNFDLVGPAPWVDGLVAPNPLFNFYAKQQTADTGTPPFDYAVALLDISKFLTQIATSPNASMGGQYSANVFVGFDVVYAIAGAPLTSLQPSFAEVQYTNGQVPTENNSNITPAMRLTPNQLPVAVNPAGTVTVQYVSLAQPWLLGQNQPDLESTLGLQVFNPGTSTFSLYGIQLYFGQK